IDTLTQSMNYQPVVRRNQPNSSTGIQGNFDAGTVVKEAESAQQYVLLPLWSPGSKDSQNIDANVAFDVKETESAVYVSLNMPTLEDIMYLDDEEDVGAKVDFSNLETSIPVSPIPTTRVYKHHPITQIIGDLSSAPQTMSMARMVKEQGSKWVFRNKKDKRGIFIRIKAQLVAQGHTQEERIDYKEVFALVLRIEAIRLFLAYASFMGFMVYVDDIIFGSTNKELCRAFKKLMKDKFQMSSMGELTFFLGLQVKQKDNGIFISRDKYVANILRKFGLTDGKSTSTLIDTEKPLLKDPDGEDVHIYSDYAGASLDRKSTTEGCQFLGCRLISWQCKKQTVVAILSTEAEYVDVASCYAQVLWIQNLIITNVSSKLMLFGLTNDDVHLMLLGHKRIGKGFSSVETPLFDVMLVPQQVQDDAEVQADEDDSEVPAAP
nr:copia protein [Tanacetum cinerariifolium]